MDSRLRRNDAVTLHDDGSKKESRITALLECHPRGRAPVRVGGDPCLTRLSEEPRISGPCKTLRESAPILFDASSAMPAVRSATRSRVSTGHQTKKTLPGQGFRAQIDATTIWAGVHARGGDGLR